MKNKILYIFLILSLSSCEIFKKLQSDKKINQSDTTNVKKESELINKVDTSKIKSESEYKRETFYFGRDTIINNYFPAQPTVYIRESGSKKEETNNYNYETRERQLIDSMRIANFEATLNKKSEISGSVLSFWQIAGLGFLGIVIIAMVVLFMWVTKKVNVISQIIKSPNKQI